MKKVFASAGMLALGAAGATAQLTSGAPPSVYTGADKPWSISGSLRGFYDDNINTAPSGPGRIDSFGIEISPAANVKFNWGATTLTSSYQYWNQYYVQRRSSDQSHDFELDLNHNFSARYSTEFTESFVIAQEPQILAGSGPTATPLRSEGDNVHNAIGLNFQAQLTQLFGLVLAYHNSIYSYSENQGNTITPGQPSHSALLDTDENTFTIDSTWTIDDETRGVFGYKFDMIDNTSDESVENDIAPSSPIGSAGPDLGYPFSGQFYVPADSRNNYSDYFYVGADHTFQKNFSGTIRVGLQYIDYYNAGNQVVNSAGQLQFVKNAQSSVSPYVDLTLNYTYGDGGALVFGFHHSHNQTDQAANAADPSAGVTEDEETSLLYITATQKLTPISPRLVGTASLQYQNSTFNLGPVNGESDNFYLLGLDLAYQFDQHFSAETGYNFDLLASDIAGRGYDRNQVFIGVKATY